MPPKQKKPPKNSYYFYMTKRKGELERQGYRFPGGMKDVAASVGHEWAAMTPEDKLPYEEQAKIAKEEGKLDLTNKFTSTGESYATIQNRMQEEKSLSDEQEMYISELGRGDGALDRAFILLKTVHCVEQIVERNQRIYWPIEIGFVAFTLRDGLQSMYWTLVDTQKTPVGYASAARECSEETGLPEPGSPSMREYRDYNKIMQNIQGFVKHWTKQDYRRGPVLFLMDNELEPAKGCLRWIANHVDDNKRRDHQNYLDNLKFYKLPKLILRLASYANQLDHSYTNVMVTHRLELSAAAIVNKGVYDYRDEITCMFHREEKASLKMHTCCRNVVLRRMYLMFEEFLPAFGIEKANRHDIQKLKEAQEAKAKATKATAAKTASATARTNEARRGSASSKQGSWEIPRRDSEEERAERDKTERMEDDASVPMETHIRQEESSVYAKRKQDDWEGSPPAKTAYASIEDQFTRPSRQRERSESPPDTSEPEAELFYRRPPPEQDIFNSVPPPEFVPWGAPRPGPAAAFVPDDFPTLVDPSSAPVGFAPAGAPRMGVGRGRGRGSYQQEDDDYKRDRDSKRFY